MTDNISDPSFVMAFAESFGVDSLILFFMMITFFFMIRSFLKNQTIFLKNQNGLKDAIEENTKAVLESNAIYQGHNASTHDFHEWLTQSMTEVKTEVAGLGDIITERVIEKIGGNGMK